MAEQSILVQKNIRFIAVPADANISLDDAALFDTEMKIDSERILQVVAKEGTVKVTARWPMTQVKGTQFAFDKDQVYYDEKVCSLPPAQAIITIALLKSYNDNRENRLSGDQLLQILRNSSNAIGAGTLTRYLTEIRNTLRTATGATEHDFIPVERRVGYYFDPMF